MEEGHECQAGLECLRFPDMLLHILPLCLILDFALNLMPISAIEMLYKRLDVSPRRTELTF